MILSSNVQSLVDRVPNPRERASLDRSIAEHMRNGRGFWPVVTIDGEPQVVKFSSDMLQSWVDHRWTPETGVIDLVPLHALPVSDWPRVRMAFH